MTDREARKKRITAQRREQILEAATEVFARKGFTAATIPEIARLAGVAAGTIYLYYPSKRDMFLSVIKNLIFTTPLLSLIARIPEGDIAATFKDILKNRFDLIRSEPVSRIPSFMGEIQRDPELKTLWVKQFLQPILSQMEGVYRTMTTSGKFRRLEPSIAVRAVAGLLFGLLMLRIIEGETSPLDRLPQDEVADDLVDFVLHGLLGTPGEKARKENVI